jgi:hypothetical protein
VPRTSGPSPWDQSVSVATSRTPATRRRALPPTTAFNGHDVPRMKSASGASASTGTWPGSPRGRRTSIPCTTASARAATEGMPVGVAPVRALSRSWTRMASRPRSDQPTAERAITRFIENPCRTIAAAPAPTPRTGAQAR